MINNFRKITNNIMPYISLGIVLVVAFILFFFFLYIAIIGAIVGAVIYLVIYLKNKFFGSNPSEKTFSEYTEYQYDESNNKNKKSNISHKGRVFDNDE